MCPARIRLDRCDILTVKADVCICSIHRSRNMKTFPLSSHILKTAGEQVQTELLKSSSEMSMGQVEMTDSGRLKDFKKLLFICLMTYIEGNEAILQQSLIECLEIAEVTGLTSLAIPALGTGRLNYPPEEVARATVEAVALHNLQYPDTTIETVNIVLLDRDVELIKTYLRMCAMGSTSLKDDESHQTGISQLSSAPTKVASPGKQSPTKGGPKGGAPNPTTHTKGVVGRPSPFARFFGLLSKIGYTHSIGVFHFTIRPCLSGKFLGLNISAGVDLAFLEDFIPPSLKQFFKDLGL